MAQPTWYDIDLTGLEGLENELGQLPKRIADPLMRMAANKLVQRIEEVAAEELESTYAPFLAALETPRIDVANMRLSVGLSDAPEHALARSIEKGVPAPIDMRTYLIPDGQEYADIRFVHQSVGTKHTQAGAPIDKPYRDALGDVKAAALGRKTLRKLRSHRPGYKLGAGETGAPIIGNRTTGVRHTTDLYAGMRRERGKHANQTQAATYRRISRKTGVGKWIYPARPPKKILPEAADRVQRHDIEQILMDILKSMVRYGM